MAERFPHLLLPRNCCTQTATATTAPAVEPSSGAAIQTLFLPAINAGIAATLASVSMVGMVSNCSTKQE
jgi:hypothetical protein